MKLPKETKTPPPSSSPSQPLTGLNGGSNGLKKNKEFYSKKDKIINKKKKEKRVKHLKTKPEPKQDDDTTTVVKCNTLNVASAPIISKDSEHIICPCGKSIMIFRRKTGLVENVFTEHQYDVTNVYINNKDPTQVISCSAKEVLVWDYQDVNLIERYELPFLSEQCYLNPRCFEEVYYKRPKQERKKPKGKGEDAEKGDNIDMDATKTKEGTETGAGTKEKDSIDDGDGDDEEEDEELNKMELVKWKLRKSGNGKKHLLGPVSRQPKCVAITTTGERVVYAYKNRLAFHPALHEDDDDDEPYTYNKCPISCLVIHPTQFIVCTGDRKGRIIVWHNLKKSRKDLVCIKLHWHSSPVLSMVFSNDGNYLMSGGREGVLVAWQLETHRKSTLPRLGGRIRHLTQSSDDRFLCVSVENNMVKILSSVTLKLVQSIMCLAEAYELPAGLSYHSPTDCLVLNGKPDGAIQFYQPKEDTVKHTIDLVGENRISEVYKRYVYPTRVMKIAISTDGVWMATIEEREDKILPTERKLKFWKYSEEKKTYSLSTLVDPPHKEDVNSLTFRPPSKSSAFDYMVVTTSNDGDAKVWVLATENNEDKEEQMQNWQLYSVANYGANKCSKTTFSHDGEVMAVLFDAVTLWDSESVTLKTCLEYNAKSDKIKDIVYCYQESADFLVGHSDKFLIVWNVAKSAIVWMLELNIELVLADPFSRHCVAFFHPKTDTVRTDLYVFDPVSPLPKCLYRNALIKKDSSLASALFVPNKGKRKENDKTVWRDMGQLYFLNKETEIYKVKGQFEEEEEGSEEVTEKKPVVGGEGDEKSGFDDIFGGLVIDSFEEEDDMAVHGSAAHIVGTPTAKFIRKLKSIPANVLPSSNILCKGYIESMLIPKSNETDETGVAAMETESSGNIGEHKSTGEIIMNNNNNNNNVDDKDDNEPFEPSKKLLKKLRKKNFDFVVDPFNV